MNTPQNPEKDPFENWRLERWILQAAARELLPESRTALCFRRIIAEDRRVKLMYSAAVHKAHYKGLLICGSVWRCPVCSAKITERRREEVTTAIAKNPQYAIALTTFTLQHQRRDGLADLLEDFNKSYRRLKAGRIWADFEAAHGLIGSISALEVTYGPNGWHPHKHALCFFRRAEIDEYSIADFLKRRWRDILKSNNRTATYEHGVDVRTANSAIADYVAKFGREPVNLKKKWTIEHELTKAPVKKSRSAEGRTPTQLLADYITGDAEAGELWTEYAKCFKGKQQLVYSKGLRKELGLGIEKSDEEIAKEEREDAHMLAGLSAYQWRVIIGNDANGELLEVAHSGDPQKVRDFLKRMGA